MAVPFIQQYSIVRHILVQRVLKRRRYPLVLMLEPLFRCNLACPGCGKINYPHEILRQQLSLSDSLSAVEECGAPVVSIAGGEPLLHKEMPDMVRGIVRRRKFVYLCTNALLLQDRLGDYEPSPCLTFSVHLDGPREHHDMSVSRPGVFDRAVESIRIAISRGFRVTVNCTLYNALTAQDVAGFFDFVTGLGIDGITLSPGFSYNGVKRQEAFLRSKASKELFREIFLMGKGHCWRFNHTPFYLDFLAGNRTYRCTPWGNPTRNIFGWQRPCYLLSDQGHAPTFQSLMEETRWGDYGPGRHPGCDNCMLHSGFEATAVNDMVANPFKALRGLLFGCVRRGCDQFKEVGKRR